MSVSAIFGSRLAIPPPYSTATKAAPPPRKLAVGGGFGLAIECSSRPQKKATAHHRKTRPRKHSPSDIRRGPAVYPPMPPLPPEWSFISAPQDAALTAAASAALPEPE